MDSECWVSHSHSGSCLGCYRHSNINGGKHTKMWTHKLGFSAARTRTLARINRCLWSNQRTQGTQCSWVSLSSQTNVQHLYIKPNDGSSQTGSIRNLPTGLSMKSGPQFLICICHYGQSRAHGWRQAVSWWWDKVVQGRSTQVHWRPRPTLI